MTDLLLLSTFLAGPQHGYALKKKAGLITGQAEIHNNLVYPLLRRFVENGWVGQQQAAGQRGQTREMYALTAKGKQELIRRLSQFTEKEAASEHEFFLRVGLFPVLDAATRRRILAERDRWLTDREEKLAQLAGAMDVGLRGGEVVRFLRQRIRAELAWILSLDGKINRAANTGETSKRANRRHA